MNSGRHLTAWLLLGLLTVVGVGGAVLGIAQSPKGASLDAAVANTLAAPNYTEVLTEDTQEGKQTDYLVYQAPDRLGGYIVSGSKQTRTYVYVIGTLEYQSLTVPLHGSTAHLSFYKETSQGDVQSLDPAHGYLPFALQGKNIEQSGNTYSFSLTEHTSKGAETGHFTYTVSGQYISEFTLNLDGASVQLIISQVGTSPPVALPAGSKLINAG
jgi:hypothetical protein